MLAALLIVAVILDQQATKLKPPSSRQREEITLIQKDQEEVQSIRFSPSAAETFSLTKGPEGFVVDGYPDFELDQAELRTILSDASHLVTNGLAGEVYLNEEALAVLGLGQEAPRATINYTDNSSITLIFGGDAGEDIKADYLMVDGDNKVYTVSPDIRLHFDRRLQTLHVVPRINFTASLIQEMRVNGKDPFVLSLANEYWQLTSPLRYPADQVAVRKILSAIGQMRLALYAGEGDAATLEQFGLASPRRTITFDLVASVVSSFSDDGSKTAHIDVPSQQITFALGDDIDRIGLYCLYEGKVYQASNLSMGFLRDVTSASLLSPRPLTLPLAQLSAIWVSDLQGERRYEIELMERVLPNNEIATDESGQVLHDPIVTINQQEIDRDAFVRQYLSLMALTGAGKVKPGFVPQEDQPAIHFIFYSAHGEQELAFFPYDALHYAMRVDGQFVDYIDRVSVENITL